MSELLHEGDQPEHVHDLPAVPIAPAEHGAVSATSVAVSDEPTTVGVLTRTSEHDAAEAK